MKMNETVRIVEKIKKLSVLIFFKSHFIDKRFYQFFKIPFQTIHPSSPTIWSSNVLISFFICFPIKMIFLFIFIWKKIIFMTFWWHDSERVKFSLGKFDSYFLSLNFVSVLFDESNSILYDGIPFKYFYSLFLLMIII